MLSRASYPTHACSGAAMPGITLGSMRLRHRPQDDASLVRSQSEGHFEARLDKMMSAAMT